jgi:acetyl/propionyl-CoA carboxylase alpha subunit
MIYRLESAGQLYEINLERQGNGYLAVIAGQRYVVEVLEARPGELSLRFDGRPVTLYWAYQSERRWVALEGCTYELHKPASQGSRHTSTSHSSSVLRAPMPAQVRAVLVAEGNQVESGQTLMLLEAMKMEIKLQAPRRGRIARLPVHEGQAVDRDQVLIELSDASVA